MDGEEEVNSMMSLSWLYTDAKGRLWEIGKQGRVFCYESKHDRFQLVYKLPKSETKDLHTPVSYGFIDDNYIVWLCNQKNIYLYDSETERCTTIKNEINESITDIEQIDANHYFIGTDVGIHYAELKDKKLMLSPCNTIKVMLINKNSKTLIWDNIPEWAIYSLEYGIEEDLFLTDEDKKLITKFIGENFPNGYAMSVDWESYKEFDRFPAFGKPCKTYTVRFCNL